MISHAKKVKTIRANEVCEFTRSPLEKLCRNIRSLFNLDPPATQEEIRASSLQYVRKISGFTEPSKTNEAAFLSAVNDISSVSARLLQSLQTDAHPKNREEMALKLKARTAKRFGH